MTPRSLVVSIHDVSPFTQQTTTDILRELREIGITHTSLLVVPDHHRGGHFLEHKSFREWLSEQVRAGDEAVIHGYYHQRERKSTDNPRQRFMTQFYTADEGEFFDIGEEEALRLVTKARDQFRQIGLNPTGFIAPAWLLSAEAESALRRLGIEYTTRLGSVIDLRHGTSHTSQSMVYSSRSAWRRVVSLAWNAWLFRRLHSNPLLRIGIHPPDFHHKRIWRQICHCIRRALEDRVPMTYGQWLRAFDSPVDIGAS